MRFVGRAYEGGDAEFAHMGGAVEGVEAGAGGGEEPGAAGGLVLWREDAGVEGVWGVGGGRRKGGEGVEYVEYYVVREVVQGEGTDRGLRWRRRRGGIIGEGGRVTDKRRIRGQDGSSAEHGWGVGAEAGRGGLWVDFFESIRALRAREADKAKATKARYRRNLEKAICRRDFREGLN